MGLIRKTPAVGTLGVVHGSSKKQRVAKATMKSSATAAAALEAANEAARRGWEQELSPEQAIRLSEVRKHRRAIEKRLKQGGFTDRMQRLEAVEQVNKLVATGGQSVDDAVERVISWRSDVLGAQPAEARKREEASTPSRAGSRGASSTQSLIRIAILASAVTSVTACSGAHPVAERQPAKPNAAFIARAERICSHARTQLNALPAFPFRQFDALHPDPHLLPRVGRFFTGPGNELPIVRRLVTKLRALGNPAANRAAWSDVLKTLREYIAVFEQEDTAAIGADTSAWVKAVRLNRRLPTRLASATAALGAKRCDVL
jgi:hypothetical protein